jgi:protein SCO1/2
MTHRRLAVAMLTIALVAGACGADSPRELSGYRREPAPLVGDITLPDLTADGADLALEAEPGHLLVVYFGYTNCPDFCPTTLSDLRLATRRMEDDLAAKVDVAMITVDPDRDVPVLADYITSFFDDGHALATDDSARLAQAAAPFGASYSVDEGEDGSIEVAHTTALYVVDDTGRLALTWQFGVEIDDLAADLSQLLEAATT